MAGYWNQQDLENLIGKAIVLGCYDDDNVGYPSAQAISEVGTLSDSEVDGALATEYPAQYPLQAPPRLVTMASLYFGRWLSYARRPEYAKTQGRSPDKAEEVARAFLARLLNAREYLTDALGIKMTPANVGGVAVDGANRIYVDSPNGDSNAGDY